MPASWLPLIAFVSAAAFAGTQPPAVAIDFLALGRDGQPVPDLTSADIQLKIGGKTAPITTLERISREDGGRRILLLLEEATVHTLEPVVQEGVKTLLASLLPGDQVTLVSTRRPSASLIRGPQAVARAVESLQAGPGRLYSCLSDSLVNIEKMVENLPRGRASTLVLLASGHPEGAATGSEGDAAPCTPRRDAMRKASHLLADAQINVMLFTVDDTNRSWGFETLASNIGATSRLLSWADTGTLARAIAETRSFYRATFDVGPAPPDRPQRVELKTTRRNVKLHASPTLTLKPQAR
jgi:hypothetical protein